MLAQAVEASSRVAVVYQSAAADRVCRLIRLAEAATVCRAPDPGVVREWEQKKMAMERRAVAALPWHLGPEMVADAAKAEAARWALVGVHSEAAKWQRVARMVLVNDQLWFDRAVAAAGLAADVTGAAALGLAEDRAGLIRGLVYFRSLNRCRQWESAKEARPEARQPAPVPR